MQVQFVASPHLAPCTVQNSTVSFPHKQHDYGTTGWGESVTDMREWKIEHRDVRGGSFFIFFVVSVAAFFGLLFTAGIAWLWPR
jgi:hypothetical protein